MINWFNQGPSHITAMSVMMSQINTKTRLVLQQFVQTNNKEKIKRRITDPVVGQATGDRWISLTKDE